ncbi:MAG: GHKL domain-containing protein, partial [bacterium]|nr:GHKL domain-containing protein [bacterium]
MTSILWGTSSGQYLAMGQARISGVIFSKVLLVAVCVILLKFKFNNNILKRGNIIILITMPIITMLSMIGIMQAFLHSNELKYDLLLAAVSVMLTNILMYYVFIKINNDVERETEIRALKQKYENDKKYIYDVEKLYSKTCGIRHDIIHHFDVISGLLGDGTDKVREYIRSVTKNQIDMSKSLIRTGNEYFDAIANIKLAVCEQLDIKVQIRVKNHSLDKLRPDEIGIIFGNLFDNAIEAAKHTQDKRIELYVQSQEERCSIQMINSIKESVIGNNRSLTTTKEDKKYHGYGIKNIKRIVKRYDGIINFFEEDNYFGCDIL